MATLKKTHERVSEFVDSIFSESTVQGLKFIGFRKLRIIERIFWFVAVTACLIFTGYLARNAYQKYKENSVIVSFQPKETSIQQISFPAITLCNVNVFKESVLQELLNELTEWNLDTSPNAESIRFQLGAALEHLTQFCLTTPSFRRKTGDLLCNGKGGIDIMEALQEAYLTANATYESRMEEFYKEHFMEAALRTILIYVKATTNCQDMILKCAWSGKEIPCGEIFFPLDTRHGKCCTFNMMPKSLLRFIPENDTFKGLLQGKPLPKKVMEEWSQFSMADLVLPPDQVPSKNYPKHQVTGGKPYGLSIVVNPELEEYSTCTTYDSSGFIMHAHSPLSMPNMRQYGSAIPHGSEVFVEVDPYATDADLREMKGIPIDNRECYIPSDTEAKLEFYNFYTVENCVAECVAAVQYQQCKCVQPHLPSEGKMPCRARKRRCAEKAFEMVMLGSDDICGHCISPCTEIEYKMAVHQFDLRDDALEYPPLFNSSRGMEENATNYSIIHIYFGSDSLYVKERKPLRSLFRFIADTGSLLGFTLGISIVSVIEILYYWTLRLYFYYNAFKRKEKTPVQSLQREGNNRDQKSEFKFNPYGILKVHVKPDIQKKNSNSLIYPFLR